MTEAATSRWHDVRAVLERERPLAGPNFEAGEALFDFVRSDCRVLVIGAGGLGCEILKDLALSGFVHIDVIDMDVVELSNLNRQFLFRPADVGKPKAVVAADFVRRRVCGAAVTPHHAPIEQKPRSFYRSFHLIVAGLDSTAARRWINAMVVSLAKVDAGGAVDASSVIPLIDGGTESLLGHVRVIIPRVTACFECSLELFPPPTKFQLCTLADTPRIPEHCVAYASELLWERHWPFGEGVSIDGDHPDHIQWLHKHACRRAKAFGIAEVTFKMTQGVVKNIVPAIATTNAVISAACVNEALKLVTDAGPRLENYLLYNGNVGVYTYTTAMEAQLQCSVCGSAAGGGAHGAKRLQVRQQTTLEELLKKVQAERAEPSSEAPMVSAGGKVLRHVKISELEESTRPNLTRSLAELLRDVPERTLTLTTGAGEQHIELLFEDER